MNPFGKKSIKNDPSFILLETALPTQSVDTYLLGCIVADMRNPTHEYCPKSTSGIDFGRYGLEIKHTNVSSFFAANKDRGLEAKLGSLLGFSFSVADANEQEFELPTVRTRTLSQHKDIKNLLLSSEHRQDILELLKDNGGVGYMVVGFKSSTDGRRIQRQENRREANLVAQAPTDIAANVASHGLTTAYPGSTNPKIEVRNSCAQQTKMAGSMEGEQIFAVQYRTLRLKGRAQAESKVEYGSIQRVKMGAGVFGDRNGRDLVFEDEDEDSKDDSDESDEEVTLSTEVAEEEVRATPNVTLLY